MKIIVDWHDTLQSYSDKFIGWYAGKHGIQLPPDANGKSFSELGIEAIEDDFKHFAQEGNLADLKNIEDAQWAMRRLGKSHKIYLVSASGFALVYQDTLLENFPEISLVTATLNKAGLCEALRGNCLIDDQLRFFKDLSPYCEGIAFAQPWNTEYKGFRGRWKEIVKYIEG